MSIMVAVHAANAGARVSGQADNTPNTGTPQTPEVPAIRDDLHTSSPPADSLAISLPGSVPEMDAQPAVSSTVGKRRLKHTNLMALEANAGRKASIYVAGVEMPPAAHRAKSAAPSVEDAETTNGHHTKKKKVVATTIRQKIFVTMSDPNYNAVAHWWSIIITLIIIVSCASFIAQTLPEFRSHDLDKPDAVPDQFFYIETVCVAIFTLEFLLRAATCASMTDAYLNKAADVVVAVKRAGKGQEKKKDDMPQFKPCPMCQANNSHVESTQLQKMFRYIRKPMNVIDIISFLPFYLDIAYNGSTKASGAIAVVRVFRLLRIMRIFRLGKFSRSALMVGKVMKKSASALYLMMFFVVLITMVFGCMIFYAEGGEWDPTVGQFMRRNVANTAWEVSPYSSIPASFWWVVVTTTTVGYGDLVPTSWLGKIIGAAAMHVGVLVLALPISIIGANFTQEYEKFQREEELIRMHAQIAKQNATCRHKLLQVDDLADSTPASPRGMPIGINRRGSIVTAGSQAVKEFTTPQHEDEQHRKGSVSLGDLAGTGAAPAPAEATSPVLASLPQPNADGRRKSTNLQVPPASVLRGKSAGTANKFMQPSPKEKETGNLPGAWGRRSGDFGGGPAPEGSASQDSLLAETVGFGSLLIPNGMASSAAASGSAGQSQANSAAELRTMIQQMREFCNRAEVLLSAIETQHMAAPGPAQTMSQ